MAHSERFLKLVADAKSRIKEITTLATSALPSPVGNAYAQHSQFFYDGAAHGVGALELDADTTLTSTLALKSLTSTDSICSKDTSCCRASRSARSEFRRLCIMLLDVFTVLVLRLRLVALARFLFAVAIVPSALGLRLRGGNVRCEAGVPSGRFAAQRMEKQRLTDSRLDGFGQERQRRRRAQHHPCVQVLRALCDDRAIFLEQRFRVFERKDDEAAE